MAGRGGGQRCRRRAARRHLVAPALIRIEVANVLRTMVARGSVPQAAAAELFALFQKAPVDIVESDDALERRALDLAIALAHPVYDCIYLALAERMAASVVTADSRLLRILAGTPLDKLARPLVA